MWKENIMKELETGELEYKTIEEFLISLKKEFSRGEEESVKAVELRKLEQREKMMEKFVQKLREQQEEVGMKKDLQ